MIQCGPPAGAKGCRRCRSFTGRGSVDPYCARSIRRTFSTRPRTAPTAPVADLGSVSRGFLAADSVYDHEGFHPGKRNDGVVAGASSGHTSCGRGPIATARYTRRALRSRGPRVLHGEGGGGRRTGASSADRGREERVTGLLPPPARPATQAGPRSTAPAAPNLDDHPPRLVSSVRAPGDSRRSGTLPARIDCCGGRGRGARRGMTTGAARATGNTPRGFAMQPSGPPPSEPGEVDVRGRRGLRRRNRRACAEGGLGMLRRRRRTGGSRVEGGGRGRRTRAAGGRVRPGSGPEADKSEGVRAN